MGYLGLFLGPMFAGKTSALIQIHRRLSRGRKGVIVLNYAGDTRYSTTNLCTHNGDQVPCYMVDTLSEFVDKFKDLFDETQNILVNEGQFFDDIMLVKDWVDKYGKRVYVCGLDGDSERNKFGEWLNLIPYCDKVTKLLSICETCGEDAPFTYRNPVESNGEQVMIGVKEYQPACRKCYLKLRNL